MPAVGYLVSEPHAGEHELGPGDAMVELPIGHGAAMALVPAAWLDYRGVIAVTAVPQAFVAFAYSPSTHTTLASVGSADSPG